MIQAEGMVNSRLFVRSLSSAGYCPLSLCFMKNGGGKGTLYTPTRRFLIDHLPWTFGNQWEPMGTNGNQWEIG